MKRSRILATLLAVVCIAAYWPVKGVTGTTVNDEQAQFIFGGLPQFGVVYHHAECTLSTLCDIPAGNVGCNFRSIATCSNFTQWDNVEGNRNFCEVKDPSPGHDCEEGPDYVCLTQLRCSLDPEMSACWASVHVITSVNFPSSCTNL